LQRKALWPYLVMSLLLVGSPLPAQELLIVTEDLPPYNHKVDGQVRGLSTQVVQAVLRELGIESPIQVYSWARSYQLALKRPDVLIYSIVRTSDREKLFHWIGEVAPQNTYLFKLASRPEVELKTLEDAKRYRVGTWRDDVSEQYLLRQGFVRGKQIDNSGNPKQNILKLLKKRLDLTSDNELSFYYRVKQLGYDPALFAKALKLDAISTPFYMAFSRQTSLERVATFRRALETVKQQGVYSVILDQYLK